MANIMNVLNVIEMHIYIHIPLIYTYEVFLIISDKYYEQMLRTKELNKTYNN